MLVVDSDVMIAAGKMIFIDEEFNIGRKIPVDFHIRDLCLMADKSAIMWGEGCAGLSEAYARHLHQNLRCCDRCKRILRWK
jgi:hypothetical protein